MTGADYDAIFARLRGMWQQLDQRCDAADCQQADFAGCVLRIAGHDFMDFQPGSGGGSDGCLDFTDGDNAGLAPCMFQGEFGISVGEAWSDFCSQVSLADFFVIAAEAVMTFTRDNALDDGLHSGTVPFKENFRYGRTTVESCSFSHGRLPNPENGCAANDQVFRQHMGLTWGETAALMAVHSLGRAKIENSGYDGFWSDAENARKFNSNYFTSILAKGWGPEKAVAGNAAKNQWKRVDMEPNGGRGKEMMLDTDLCLAYSGDACRGGACTRRPLKAADLDCCAWAVSGKSRRARAQFNLKMCGQDDEGGNFRRQTQLCCCSGCTTLTRNNDCGAPQLDTANVPNAHGPAASDIVLFARDEGAWIAEFVAAWTKATGNGFADLKQLG